MILVAATRGVYSGPIDGLQMSGSAERCPLCGEFLLRIPAQEGTCHSGRFATRCAEHYWCETCEESFVCSTFPTTNEPPQ